MVVVVVVVVVVVLFGETAEAETQYFVDLRLKCNVICLEEANLTLQSVYYNM